ncbi:MAG: hypothetical protein ABR552_06825 [Actinomycetota bacterium]|nr:hypothetical protein [Actinomycetota bacterium]
MGTFLIFFAILTPALVVMLAVVAIAEPRLPTEGPYDAPLDAPDQSSTTLNGL